MNKTLVTQPVGHNLRGRPKGAKNKTTLFKEIMQVGFEKSLEKEFKKVITVVIDKAKQGDMKAAKMLFDRVIPVSKAVDLDNITKGGFAINITVGEMQPTIEAAYEVVEEKENVKEAR